MAVSVLSELGDQEGADSEILDESHSKVSRVSVFPRVQAAKQVVSTINEAKGQQSWTLTKSYV